MLLEVSSGEAFDKLTILEIKSERIQSPEKKKQIEMEILALVEVLRLKERYPFEYAFLKHINEEIWDLTELFCEEQVILSLRIFELNKMRFRVKRLINTLESSSVKEQKSTGEKHCLIIADVEPQTKRTEIACILFDYDTFSFDRPCEFLPFPVFVETTPTTYTAIKLSTLIVSNKFFDTIGKFL
jgi:hypothetical protein